MKRKNILLLAFFLTLFVFQQAQAGGTMPSVANPSINSAPPYAYLDHVWLYVLKLHPDGTKVSPDTMCLTGDTGPGCAEAGQSFPAAPNPIYIDVESEYLPNVLPREMDVQNNDPTLPAAQAQAVAARTYATWTARNKPYDDPLGYDYNNQINNSTEYQVYYPDSYNHFLNPNDPEGVKQMISTAISSTLGTHITISDGSAIDAEFGSDIANQSNDEPSKDYLNIIQDPISTISTICGAVTNYSGWGMSQKGALRWSKGNQCATGGSDNTAWPVTWSDYRQILAHYYTGIDILGPNGKVAPDDRWNLLNYTIPPGGETVNAGGTFNVNVTLQNTSTSNWATDRFYLSFYARRRISPLGAG